MSPRLIIVLALVAIIAVSAGVVIFIIVQTDPTAVSGAQAQDTSTKPASDARRHDYREKLFSGDPDRNIRGGQEMKPRW